MASINNSVARAYRRVLREIVIAERARAENAPLDERNVRFGLTEPDLPLKEARRQIEETFGEILLMLDQLHVAHMAAQFEFEAKQRLEAVIAAARNAVKESRKGQPQWAADLVRDVGSLEGLRDIEKLIRAPPDLAKDLKRVRTSRNKFCHGVKLEEAPEVTAAQALTLLLNVLERVR